MYYKYFKDCRSRFFYFILFSCGRSALVQKQCYPPVRCQFQTGILRTTYLITGIVQGHLKVLEQFPISLPIAALLAISVLSRFTKRVE